LALDLSHRILRILAKIRKAGEVMTYLRPDAKSQVTIRYSDSHQPESIESIVVSTQHDPFDNSEEHMRSTIEKDIRTYVIPQVMEELDADTRALFNGGITYHINPTGLFIIGGPHGDTGLTGRKIIVDTYGGKGAHGGGAFSGKDPSKVDRSAAYAARHMAKNMVAAGVADQVLVQVAYAIGVVEPVSVLVDTYGTSKVPYSDSELGERMKAVFDMRPGIIEQRLKLRQPMYGPTAAYGHMGRNSETVKRIFERPNGATVETLELEVELFTWEKLDFVEQVKAAL